MSTKEVKLNAIFFYWLTISLILVFSLIIVVVFFIIQLKHENLILANFVIMKDRFLKCRDLKLRSRECINFF